MTAKTARATCNPTPLAQMASHGGHLVATSSDLVDVVAVAAAFGRPTARVGGGARRAALRAAVHFELSRSRRRFQRVGDRMRAPQPLSPWEGPAAQRCSSRQSEVI